ncbi:MAG: lytic transglycosylase domain-containing protein [Pseudomonadota bacterium]
MLHLRRMPGFAPALALITALIIASMAATATAASLREGMDAVTSKDTQRALAIRAAMRPGSVDRKTLAWAIALSSSLRVPPNELAKIAGDLPDWPGQITMRSNYERAVIRLGLGDSEIIRVLGGTMPASDEGKRALAQAYMRTGQTSRASAIIKPFYYTEKMSTQEQSALIKQFAPLLTKADHKRRMDAMLYDERVKAALALAPLANAESLAAGRGAVVRREGAAAALGRVHPSWNGDAGLLFSRIQYLRRADRPREAAQLLLSAPRDPNVLVDPDEWWVERRLISRDLLDLGDPATAYNLVAGHSATGRRAKVDAEFHAGWYALRFLGDRGRAQQHFANILQTSSQPLSVSRANYWLGRTAEAGGNRNRASQFYRAAAAHPGTFYGQLASAKIGVRKLGLRRQRASGADRAKFARRPMVQAIKALEDAGYGWRASLLYRHLGRTLNSAGEVALLALNAERRGDYNLSLQVGKLAYTRGLPADTLAFPLGVIPKSANISAVGKALAYSIARQESAFHPDAKSPAGALGLLQLLPGTAEGVAKRHGLRYSKSALTRDPALNATLGAKYFGEQRARFNGSYVLTLVAYNAGPRRASEWVARFGNPAGRSVEEVVDWIERIPFTETRNYVMRILENYQVYKTRIAGSGLEIEADLRKG